MSAAKFLRLFCLWALLLAATSPLAAEETRTMRVFFIGNSLIYWADLPRQIADFAAAHGSTLEYGEQIRSGRGLRYHWETADGLEGGGPHEKPARIALTEEDWDAVVLQPMSREFLPENRAQFAEYAKKLTSLIPEQTPIFLYAYWPYRSESMDEQDRINEAFAEVREQLAKDGRDVRILPIGEAFREAVKLGFPREDLYLDEVHASAEGMHLAALVKYASLFDRDPRGLPNRAIHAQPKRHDAVEIPPETASLLQSAALEAVRRANVKPANPANEKQTPP
jgi:hypothetical protein